VRCALCAVRGARCAVRCVRCAVRGAWCAVRGARCAVRFVLQGIVYRQDRVAEFLWYALASREHIGARGARVRQFIWYVSRYMMYRTVWGWRERVFRMCPVPYCPARAVSRWKICQPMELSCVRLELSFTEYQVCNPGRSAARRSFLLRQMVARHPSVHHADVSLKIP
jgi:hypothetical protein